MDDMIDELATWTCEPCIDGFAFRSPSMHVQIRPRVHAWSRVDDLLDTIANTSRATRNPITQLRTREGEPAFVASAEVADGHVSVAIAGGEPFAHVIAIGVSSTHALTVAIVRDLALGLGSVRTRPFVYTPPPRWLGLRRERRTIWLHPAYPSIRARITMFDARPFRDTRDEQLARKLTMELHGTLQAARVSPPEDLALDAGLAARMLLVEGNLEGREVVRCAASAADDRFMYAGHFEGPRDVMPAFREAFASLQPLPV
jgi:hypothetical protein